jgi:NAD(P)-dependent dehydrogenase (short-subunit alcohol dehydrogenase family)
VSLPRNPRAVVTGAGSGLGAALCRALAMRGATVVASDVDLAAAQATAAACGAGAHAVRCDVTRLAEVEALADAADRLLGGVDLIVNNAGVAVAGQVGDVSLDDWRWIVDINLWGVIHGCHVFAPRLRAQGRGHVLNVASAAGLLSPPQMAPYNVTKAAVVALSETMYSDLAPAGVGVTVLCPTFFPTNIGVSARASDPALAHTARKLVEGGKLTADDVARAALDGCDAGALHVAPQADGRWMWRVKRLAPRTFHRLAPKVTSLLVRKLGRQ